MTFLINNILSSVVRFEENPGNKVALFFILFGGLLLFKILEGNEGVKNIGALRRKTAPSVKPFLKLRLS